MCAGAETWTGVESGTGRTEEHDVADVIISCLYLFYSCHILYFFVLLLSTTVLWFYFCPVLPLRMKCATVYKSTCSFLQSYAKAVSNRRGWGTLRRSLQSVGQYY